MEFQKFCEYTQIGGCTARATNKFSKTAQAKQRHASQLKATHYCCLGGSDNKGNSKQSSSNSNSKKISRNRRQPFTNLLLIAAMTLATLAQQQQIAAGYMLPEAELTAADASSSSSSSSSSEESSIELPHLHSSVLYDQGSSNMRRTRLRKRHSNHLYFDSHLHESSTALEWQNPCGGFYDPMHNDGNAAFGHHETLPLRFYIKPLRLSTRQEYRTLNETLHAIDISDIEMWRSHKQNYRFLPNLKRNSSIALKRWYRNMQTYVAAFAYLGRTQYKWDHSKLMYTSQTTKELNELLLSARRILCEIETAINGSFPHDSPNKLNAISREEMNRRLRFRTRRHSVEALVEADKIDLKFTKYSFYDFLSTMWKVLRKNSKRRGQVALHHQRESSDQLQSEENASMSLRAISGQSMFSSSASESFELIDGNSKKSSGRKHANHHAGGGKKRRSHQQHAQQAELNEV